MSSSDPRPLLSSSPLAVVRRPVAWFPALFLLALSAALGQVLDETFEGSAEVVEVQVPVNVTDRDGQPVRGLKAADFELFDEGKRQTLTDFRVVDLDLLEPDVDASIPAGARRHILLLFDLSFSSPASILRARQAAQRFVTTELHPSDLVAVAVHSIDAGARLVVTFTPDRAQLARAIDTLGAPQLLDQGRRDPLRFVIESPDLLSALASNDAGERPNVGLLASEQMLSAYFKVLSKQMVRSEKAFAAGRISSWSRSMADMARMMASVQGRKHVVYFSEGFDGRLLLGRTPSGVDEEQQEDMRNLQTGQYWMVDMDDIYGNSGLQSDVGLMLEEFRRSDCVIQAVDISGLGAETADEQRIKSVGKDALFYLANDTGGELYQDANDFGPELGRVLERSTVTYLLSFKPSELTHDGAYRRLKVKADVPRGGRLSFRRGYYAPRPFEGLHPLEKSLLASDAIAAAIPSRDLELDVLAAAFRATDTEAYVPVIVEVGGEGLLAGQKDDQLTVELYTYVTDEAGEMRDFFTQMVSLEVGRNRAGFARTGLKYYGHMDLGPGRYLVRVLVRNAVTGRTGVAAVPLEVPQDLGAAPMLLPPFFLEEPGRWFLVRENQRDGYQRSVIYPFTVNGEPYVPSAHPVLKAQAEAQLCLVAYNLGGDELAVDAKVLSGEGVEVPGGGTLGRVERTVTGIAGLDKLLATFRPNGLAAGSYTLQVAVHDAARGTVETNSIPFTILD